MISFYAVLHSWQYFLIFSSLVTFFPTKIFCLKKRYLIEFFNCRSYYVRCWFSTFFFSTLSYCSLYPFFNHSIYLICFSFNYLFFNVIIPVFTVFRLAYAKSYLVTNHSFVFFFQFSFNISYCFQRNIFCHQIVKHCALYMFFPKSFLFFLLYLLRPVLNLHFLKYIVHNIKFSQKFLRIV